MVSISSRLFQFAAVLLVSWNVAASTGDTAEETAFLNGIQVLIESAKNNEPRDKEVRWSESLDILALSKSRQADLYLAQLGLFSLDGVIAEEYGCAVSKKGKQLSRQLRQQLKKFERANICAQFAKDNGIKMRTLCSTKNQFQRIVSQYSRLPLKDVAGACD